MKLAINGQQLARTHVLSRILDVLDRLEVTAIELWPWNIPGKGKGKEDEQRYEKRDVEGAADLLRQRGITCACVTLGFRAAPFCFASGGARNYTAALMGAVDAATTLGAAVVNTYSVGIPLSLWAAAARPAAEYARAKGVVITLENEAHDESGLPEQVAAAVESVDSVGLGTEYDPCNYYHAGIEPFPHAYTTIRRHIRYVHLKGGCEYHPGRPGIRKGYPMRDTNRDFISYVPLPDAAFNVEAMIRALHRDGYAGWLTLEPHVSGANLFKYYRREVPYVQKLLAGLPHPRRNC
ncbi:MAG: sugar phosphate isomerase/epimerase [Opitutae bacterium]|nr:sugar phosphate isomerase/epimerase [Opitutae bacterium]